MGVESGDGNKNSCLAKIFLGQQPITIEIINNRFVTSIDLDYIEYNISVVLFILYCF